MVKSLIHIRHAIRDFGEKFLNQNGVELSRRVGDEFKKRNLVFDYVITSTLDRAIQTSIAMGYAVNRTEPTLSTFGEEVQAELDENRVSWDAGFVGIQNIMHQNSELDKFMTKQIALYTNFLNEIKNNGSLLIVSHGGIVDYPLIKLFYNETDVSKWGSPFGYCEGYIVNFEKGRFYNPEFIRW
jgi:phosphohistidine phosphatase SixA